MRIIGLLFSLFLGSCQWQSNPKPSVLVIAINRLGAQDVICQDQTNELERTGFNSFCGEAVRFTHAYSTSPQAQAAMASLLTGLHSDSHGVWHNGSQFVSGKNITVAEAALKNGFKTSFFSGGPPVWSKSGLRQGFEVFDDNFQISMGKIYRPVLDNFREFLRWLDDSSADNPFFSVIFLPDLEFDTYPTIADSGESRKKSVQSQIMEIDESLDHLFKGLRKRNRWNSTTVVITGLSGRDESELREFVPPENVFSENLQVALFVKLARKNPDQGGNWKFDKNVSIADVGSTLFDLVGAKPQPTETDKFHSQSITEALQSPQVNWSDDRPLLAGSGWPAWLKWGENRISIRSGYFLILLKSPLVMFNTLTDKLENTGQVLPANYWPGFLADISEKSLASHLPYWTLAPKELVAKLRLAKTLFSDELLTVEQKERILKMGKEGRVDNQVLGWAAMRALELNDWPWLKKLGEIGSRLEWKLVAQKAMGEKVDLQTSICLGLLNHTHDQIMTSVSRNCEEPMLADLAVWLKSKDVGREANRDSFIRDFQYYLMGREIAVNNYLMHLAWDVDRAEPSGPSFSELLLKLPEYKKFLEFVNKRIGR